jgi:hypothetical protein
MHRDQLKGIAGAASGGDILFQELCAELDIPSEIFLGLPIYEYKKASVSFAGRKWEERFEKLIKTHPVEIFRKDKEQLNNIWEESNLWMLHEALKAGGKNMTMIALWDGKGGDGAGGTEHMVRKARESGANTIIIDTKKL